jgi:hypothetical protein
MNMVPRGGWSVEWTEAALPNRRKAGCDLLFAYTLEVVAWQETKHVSAVKAP